MVPANPEIYHIVHWDRLESIIKDGFLFADAVVSETKKTGTTIGMSSIKGRRKRKSLSSYPDLKVGACVPFYFCPRSVMLHSIHVRNLGLEFKGGQEPIVHLVSDFDEAVKYAKTQNLRWAFTSSNAGSEYFRDFCSENSLNEIDWSAVAETNWRNLKESKQAEFLMERNFPWTSIKRIGVSSNEILTQVNTVLNKSAHKPQVRVMKSWYY